MAKNKDFRFQAIWLRRDKDADLGSKRVAKYWFEMGQKRLMQVQSKNADRLKRPCSNCGKRIEEHTANQCCEGGGGQIFNESRPVKTKSQES